LSQTKPDNSFEVQRTKKPCRVSICIAFLSTWSTYMRPLNTNTWSATIRVPILHGCYVVALGGIAPKIISLQPCTFLTAPAFMLPHSLHSLLFLSTTVFPKSQGFNSISLESDIIPDDETSIPPAWVIWTSHVRYCESVLNSNRVFYVFISWVRSLW
jgi:hypothetical protein